MNESLPADAASPSAATGGALLRRAREAQGVHIAALAVALKVPTRQLEALEADRLDDLPDLVFARALAASVCRQLKIDAAPLLAAFPHSAPRLRTDQESLNERFEPPGSSAAASWRERLARAPVLVALALLVGAVLLLVMPLVRPAAPLPPAPEPAAAGTPAPAPEAAPAASAAVPAASATPGMVTESVTPALSSQPLPSASR